MPLRFALLALLLSVRATASPTDDAIALFKAGKYPEAQAALQVIVAHDPPDGRACSYLGQSIARRSHDAAGLDPALPWMEKATKLAPNDPEIMAAYGEIAMGVGGAHLSIGTTLKGRDAIEAALKLNPADLEARSGLYQYYSQAPWPLGNKAKAAEQLEEEIRKLNPDRAAILLVGSQTSAKDYAERVCHVRRGAGEGPEQRHRPLLLRTHRRDQWPKPPARAGLPAKVPRPAPNGAEHAPVRFDLDPDRRY